MTTPKKTLIEHFGDFVQDIEVILNPIADKMGKVTSKSTLRFFLRFNKFSYKIIRKITSLKKNDMAVKFFKQELEYLELMKDNGEIVLSL